MSQFKAFLLGFSLVMGFMTVSLNAQADQACVQECLAEGLATPATKRKIASGVLSRSQMVTILTRKCVTECAQAELAPESEPTAAYQPPIVADPEPPAQPEAEGTDGGEATDDAGAGEIAPIEPETMPATDVPGSTDDFLKTSLEVQSQLADKVDRVALEDLMKRVSALEKQLAAQSETHSTREDEPTHGIDPADTVAEAVPAEPETPDTNPTPAVNSEAGLSDITIVAIACAFLLFVLIAVKLASIRSQSQKKLENALQVEAADEHEDEDTATFKPLPSEPPPIGGGAAAIPPRLPSDRIVIGNPVEFKQSPILDPDL